MDETPEAALQENWLTKKGVFVFLVVTLLVLLGGGLFTLNRGVANSRAIADAKMRRFESLELIDQLRQSSDELTRMARSHAATGDPRFEEYFERILSIRKGEAPRPVDYDRVYWDHVVAGGSKPRTDGDPVSLRSLMEEAGFTSDELATLRKAERRSEQLALLEKRSMNAVKGLFEDDDGEFTRQDEPDLAFARQLLHGDEYHQAKSEIMALVDQAEKAVNKRTADEVDSLIFDGRELQVIGGVLGIGSLVVVVTLLLMILRGGRTAMASDGIADETGEDGKTILHSFKEGLLESWPLLLASLLAIALIAGISIRNMSRQVVRAERELEDALTTVRDTTAKSVHHWFLERQQEIRVWAGLPEVAEVHDRLAALGSDRATLLEAPAQSQLRALLEPLVIERAYSGYLLVADDGTVLASDREVRIGFRGTDEQDQLFLEKARRAPRFSHVSLPGEWFAGGFALEPRATILAGACVRGSEGAAGAVLVFLIDPEDEFTEILQRGRLGESGESYAFNRDGQLISESRFDDDLRHVGLIRPGDRAILNVEIRDPGGNLLEGHRPSAEVAELPLTRMAEAAIKGQVGVDLSGYADYRGVPVVGSWMWNEEFGYGICTEMDVAEASMSMTDIRRQAMLAILFSGVLLLVLTGIFIWSRMKMATVNDELKASERKTRDSEQRVSTIIQSSADGIISIDNCGRIGLFNSAAEEIFGYKAAEVLGKNVKMLMPEPVASDHDRILADYNPHHSSVVGQAREVEAMRRDGSTFPMELKVTEVSLGGERMFIGLVRDISERKENEARMAEAREAAEAATRAKSDFLANMSHEIRTPMNAIIGLSDLCLRTELEPKQHDYISKVNLSAKSLLGIINDILDFSKIEAGKLDIENVPFFIDEVLENVGTMISVKTQEKGLELLFDRADDVPPSLIGDPLRLGQILINLANNAVKFTDSGEVVVRISKEEDRDDDQVVLKFSVQDTGIGMSEEQMGRLFQSFSQADSSTTRKYGGTGLGLAISKQLVEMMDGRIWVDSAEGHGSTFSFTATLGVGEDKDGRDSFTLSPDLRDLHALVVDDNDTSREILVHYLTSFGFQVRTAENAEQAFETIENHGIEFVAMDWMMPGMNGIDATIHIKTKMGLKKVPKVILISAFAKDELVQKDGAEFADGILTKPISPSHLFDAAMEAFGRDDLADAQARHRRRKTEQHTGTEAIKDAHILLVEDNQINQQVASELLEQAGLIVDVANHGGEAVEMVAKANYDAVLMDIQMPIMDGFTATGKIREQEPFQDLPILAMTANATVEDRQKALDHGMNDHIPKPIDPDVLMKALLKWISPQAGNTEPDAEAPPSETPPSSSSAEGGTLPEIPGIDLETATRNVGGNSKLLRKLLQDFQKDHADDVEKIQSALDASDLEQAQRIAHTVKGIAGTLAASELQAAAAKLESLLKAEDGENAQRQLGELAPVLEGLLSGLTPGADSGEAPTQSADAGPLDLEQVRKLCEELDALLEEMDPDSQEKLEELSELITGHADPAQIRSLTRHIDGFEFEEAQAALDSLRQQIFTES